MKTFWVLEPGRFYFIEADFFQRYADFFPDLDLKKYDRISGAPSFQALVDGSHIIQA